VTAPACSDRPFRADPASNGPNCAPELDHPADLSHLLAATRRVGSASALAIGLSSPPSSASGGFGMKDDQGKRAGQTAPASNGSRQDRLKLALRENLKRRKSQARGRGDPASASSEPADSALDDANRKPPGR
jgi:hypothetical protein